MLPSTVKSKNKQEQNRHMIQFVPEIIFLQDKNKNYIYGSKLAEDFLQNGIDKTAKKIIKTEELELLSGQDDSYILKHNKPIIKEKTAFDNEGKEHWYKITKSPICLNEQPEGIVTIVKNIDDEKASDIRKETFLSTLAHDLKNVLQAQIRSLELINKGSFGEITKNQAEMLDMTIESAYFMKSLLCSITKTCKENNGIIHIERENFCIKKLLTKCITEINQFGQERMVCIDFTSKMNEVSIYADKTILRRVIENILNNVVSYAYPGTNVVVTLQKLNDKIILSFENNSKTISDELKARLFDKYISSRRNGFNVGLGLYFCKKAIDIHEGKIYLENKEEKNKFIVEIPLLDKNAIMRDELSL